MTLALRLTEIEEAHIDAALSALGRAIRTMGSRAELSLFCAWQDLYRARLALAEQSAASHSEHI